ncbi:protein TASOR [Lacerta agilis]|uniref:protein TASOR n=1 Tax=Lacerta agilis TaxID=80427 RepID=UPI00141969E5|nr:protein TASOR [Lacerta agilis]
MSGGGERVPEQPQRAENSSGLFGGENRAAAAAVDAENSTQNGGRPERSRSDEEAQFGAAGEGKGSPRGDHHKGSGPEQQPKYSDGLPRAPEDNMPLKKNFQIPRKSKEKKALFQPVTAGSREFKEIVNILHSSYLENNSKDNFTYKIASLVHSELLEKEFIEKRRELKQDGRSEKELEETFAFLKVDRNMVENICENGLLVGHSKLTVLGNSSLGVYLSRYADLLQANPLEARAVGDIIIFKVIKGKMKTVSSNLAVKSIESTVKSGLDPTPKHECHVLKNADKIRSLLSYRAYERTQYYFYEYYFDEIRPRLRPRHVCPYAAVSFSHSDEKVPKYLPPPRTKISNVDKSTDKESYTLWKGQLLNRGTLVCHAALKSEMRPLLPCKLPEKLDVDMVMNIEHLKHVFPRVLQKEIYSGEREEFRNGMYCSLYEVVEKTRSGSNLEGILQKLETDKLVIVKPLVDRGYLLLLSSNQMASPYDNRNPHILQALFLFRNPRGVVTSILKNEQKNAKTLLTQEAHVVMPEFTRFIQSLHYGYIHSRKDPKADLNTSVEKHINDYLKRNSKFNKEFILYNYSTTLDEKKHLYPAPKNKSNIESALRNYIFGSETYQISVSKAKKIMDGNRKPQQFSPISDYEATEEESDYRKRKARKRNGSECETVVAKRKPGDHGDYDEESIKELINLIQCKKKNVDRDSDTEDNRNESRLKQKLKIKTESPQKHFKTSESSENICQPEGGRTTESLLSMIHDLGGHDTDLRQQNVANNEIYGFIKRISAMANKQDPAESYSEQLAEYNSILPQISNLLNASHVENVQLNDPQSPKLEVNASCLPYSSDVSASEVDIDHAQHLKEASTGSASSFDGGSPCPSTPLEQTYHRQHSGSYNVELTEMHWKLIPITGGAGRVPEEQLRKHGANQTGLKSQEELLAYSPPEGASEKDPRVISRRSSDDQFAYSAFTDTQEGRIEEGEENFEDRCELETEHFLPNMHSITGIIETAILEEYNLFTKKIQEILKQKNIMYVSAIPRPVLSAQEKVMRLSEYICLQASDIAVQEYIENLSEQLSNVVASSSSYAIHSAPFTRSPGPVSDSVTDTGLHLPPEEPVALPSDFGMEQFPELPCNKLEEDSSINEQNHLAILDTGKKQSSVSTNIEVKSPANPNVTTADPVRHPDKIPTSTDNLATPTDLSAMINQIPFEDGFLKRIFKIIKDVQKNVVKFYIHEKQENALCKEIKAYLTKLGNTECHPRQFLRGRTDVDKLLIIIQNEDIHSIIHKIPCLVDLKRLPCVDFAGVDSLDDLKNRTYYDLFVSGGFLVSDESVLNPESITVDKLNSFLKFLEALSTPDGKWQWKIHCKIQKKLKELCRTNRNATSLLTLLNTYQQKHLVEILSYHSCDCQSRNPPDLGCLIRLQAEYAQQRHIVFLTEKNVLTFATYAENGIVVTTVDQFMQNFKSLVGHHNSHSSIDHERQSVLVENDEKDEEDMSLDSGDEASQIEVCNDASKYDSHLEACEIETKGSHGTDTKQNSQTVMLLPAEGHGLLTEKTSIIDMQDIQPVTPVSTTCSIEGERSSSVQQVPFSYFQSYNRQLSVPHQFSHFNVLTHQTFLGAAYPMPTSRIQEGGNYFLTAYSQNMDMDQTSSPNNWDVSYDSSRLYSKQN